MLSCCNIKYGGGGEASLTSLLFSSQHYFMGFLIAGRSLLSCCPKAHLLNKAEKALMLREGCQRLGQRQVSQT